MSLLFYYSVSREGAFKNKNYALEGQKYVWIEKSSYFCRASNRVSQLVIRL
ncbi:hypothetical protein POREN0001_0512 [Porphyromonas endodontalis ATCC 35406]|uniref:Uncharacterized protein n=1 Tax=Porphyromonas endodontalis (strain ATCC 35406 / DSM 24491 / JCM 8526 / CCUG 16442 / BCRC 14492 / NCTC 13058 / HG 370) TaxID=553175 RepID=C3J8J6_POREA|nr:hypothetical protein POREN0001_0512 [Porphyromonas endodontalis ATCC 35406]